MLLFFLKILVAAIVIAFASWLSGKRPDIAGFIVALPLVSILAIFFSYFEHQDSQATITFAKSIMIGVPISYLFFVPFFLAERYQLSFFVCFSSGIALLGAGFFIHKELLKYFS